MLNPFEDIVSWSIKNSKAGNWLILCWSNVDRTKIKTWNSKSGNRHIFRRCLQWPMMLQQQLQIPQRQWFDKCRTSLFLKNEQVSRRKCLWIMWFTSYYPYWWNGGRHCLSNTSPGFLQGCIVPLSRANLLHRFDVQKFLCWRMEKRTKICFADPFLQKIMAGWQAH